MSKLASLSLVIDTASDSTASIVTLADDVMDGAREFFVILMFRICTSEETVPPPSISAEPEINTNLYRPDVARGPDEMLWAATAPPSVSVKSSKVTVDPSSTLRRYAKTSICSPPIPSQSKDTSSPAFSPMAS